MSNQVIKGCGHHHVALYASDFDKSLKFYTEVLGFQMIREWLHNGEKAAMLDVGDGSILEMFGNKFYLEHPEKRKNGLFWHLAYKVDDVDAAYQAALAGGATSTQVPTDVNISCPTAPLSIRNAFVLGLDGEMIEFLKVLK